MLETATAQLLATLTSVVMVPGRAEPVIGPAGGRTRWLARDDTVACIPAARRLAMTGSGSEFATRDAAIGFEITLAGGRHHACRQRRWRRVAIPAASAALGVEIIAQRLLIETRLRLAGFIDIRRPEPRTVGGHHLVDQDDAPVAIPAEFEFGVGDNDALFAADLFAERVDRAGHALQLIRHLVTDDLAHACDRDVFVVAGLGLGRRTEDRGLQLGAFDEAGRKLLAGEC